MNDFYTQLFSGCAVLALGALGAMVWKVMTKIDPILEFMKKTDDRLEMSEARLSVHDSLWSQNYRQVIRSDLISMGKDDWPKGKPIRES